MNIDLATIALILVISSVFQAIIVFAHSSKYSGTYHFGIGCSLFALGFLFVMLQGRISYPQLTIVISNSLLLLALIFQYMGLVRFLNLNEKNGFL
nr:hypothetical protein [uncultured Acetobacterium sp.]